MRALIAEDDFINRRVMQLFLAAYGKCDVADNGKTALTMFRDALENRKPYNLVCLDDGIQDTEGRDVLKEIRSIESERSIYGRDGSRIVVISPEAGRDAIIRSFRNQCDAFMVKPFKKRELIRFLNESGLVPPEAEPGRK